MLYITPNLNMQFKAFLFVLGMNMVSITCSCCLISETYHSSLFFVLTNCGMLYSALFLLVLLSIIGEGALSEGDSSITAWPGLALPHWGQSEKGAKPGQIPGQLYI